MWENLNNHELYHYARQIVKNQFNTKGFHLEEKDNIFIVKSNVERSIEVLVRSVRSTTNYVLIKKKMFDANQADLYLTLVIFTRGFEPEMYLIPAQAFLKPNEMFRDRPNYEEPEFGMNISMRNMPLLYPYRFDTYLQRML